MDDNVNSYLFSMNIHLEEKHEQSYSDRLLNLSYPITLRLTYLEVSIHYSYWKYRQSNTIMKIKITLIAESSHGGVPGNSPGMWLARK